VSSRAGRMRRLSDAWQRSGISRPTVERMVVSGGFDAMYGLDVPAAMRPRGRLTRRDLLLQVADLERLTRGGAAWVERACAACALALLR